MPSNGIQQRGDVAGRFDLFQCERTDALRAGVAGGRQAGREAGAVAACRGEAARAVRRTARCGGLQKPFARQSTASRALLPCRIVPAFRPARIARRLSKLAA